MHAVEVIARKRRGEELSAAEISWFVDAYVRGEIAHEQMSAMLMAVCWRGMSGRECAEWTQAYVRSGVRLSFDAGGRPLVDKHSTGGVGDKITLVLTPLVMALGGAVPQLSGRGLGHTGGTLDKLEAIAGFCTTFPAARMQELIRETGGFIAAASEELAPADRMIYALRDVTATVESIPLIAASIMSKKIAEGTEGLVLDVKVGRGAFMKDEASARELGAQMMAIGAGSGVATRVVLSGMDGPLGRTAGNAVEVREAMEVLAGGGPTDVRELTLVLAREMLELAGLDADGAERALDDGRAMDAFSALVRAQGGEWPVRLPEDRVREVVLAERSGWIHGMDAMRVGMAAWKLGAGRARKEDAVDHAAGVTWVRAIGEHVQAGDPVWVLHASGENGVDAAREELRGAIEWGDEPASERTPVVLGVMR